MEALMAQTTFSGPLASGDKAAGVSGGSNIGYAQLVQSATLNFDATLVQSATFNLPINSIITGFNIDVLTAYDSATSATLTIGTAAAGTQYAGSVNAKTTGRAAPTYSAAQLLAASNITTNTSVVVTVTSVGQPTAGKVFISVEYVQTTGV
jgi:hypothetical protein